MPRILKLKLLQNTTFLILIIFMVSAGYYFGQKFNAANTIVKLKTGQRYSVSLRGDEPQLGENSALLTIVVFSDFECPFCQSALPELINIVKKHPEDIRLIYKHLPLPSHNNAMESAKVAWAAHKQNQFWPIHDWLLKNKASLFELDKQLERSNLVISEFEQDKHSALAQSQIKDDLLSAQKLGLGATPTFVVNGHIYSGFRNKYQWEKIIQHEIKASKALLAEGIPRNSIYANLMMDALSKRESGLAGPEPDQIYAISTGKDRPQLGPDNALVTIIEFSDFHCPFCNLLSNTLKRAQLRHPNNLRIIFRQLPLPIHEHARLAALASLAAHEQNAFWPMHDKLFKSPPTSETEVIKIADELNLDMKKFAHDLGNEKTLSMLNEDIKIAEQYKISRTPSFFVNGRYFTGAVSNERLEQLIQEALSQARAIVKHDTPNTQSADVYSTIIQANLNKGRL